MHTNKCISSGSDLMLLLTGETKPHDQLLELSFQQLFSGCHCCDPSPWKSAIIFEQGLPWPFKLENWKRQKTQKSKQTATVTTLAIQNLKLKTERVKADGNDDLLSLVCAVAMFCLWAKLTGPYWQLMESSVKHPDFHVYVQKMEACCDRWKADSSVLLD